MSTRRAALEAGFPSAQINRIAEQESWRKEVNRPTYHLHKWWANRLGSVFRAILIAALSPEGADVGRLFYEPVRFPDAVVLDPMMGSGTTIGEALKLGCKVIGQDINPVAYLQVRSAITPCDLGRLDRAYERLAATVAPRIAALYALPNPQSSTPLQTLYSFWVKRVACPECGAAVRLFDTYIFARHVYPARVPTVHSVCPHCGEIGAHHIKDAMVRCGDCGERYDPAAGPVRGAYATCPSGHRFKILSAIGRGGPPEHSLYASLVRTPGGEKAYLRARVGDDAGMARAAALLREQQLPYPLGAIEAGYNTDQLRSYGYRFWHELFTPRQLYGLALLTQAVAEEQDPAVRCILALLVSGTVEFNNLLCSYKGEGTGAVRPAFSHHILKPERMPLENTVWGLPESSGCFSTLYHSRLRRAIAYRQAPFELRVAHDRAGKAGSEKVFGLAAPMSARLASNWTELINGRARALIACGDARRLPLPDGVVDAIITDPPYFDFVHYSELADLFHGWLRLMVSDVHPACALPSTRQQGEVQQRDAAGFTRALTEVLLEAARVLKPDGVLAFSFHHSRDEGWIAVGRAIIDAGLAVVTAHPVKAEMSVATPKAATSEAIDLDAIVVCKRRTLATPASLGEVFLEILTSAVHCARAYQSTVERPLTRGDLRVILQSQCLTIVSRHAGCITDGHGRTVDLATIIGAAGDLLDMLVAQVTAERVPA